MHFSIFNELNYFLILWNFLIHTFTVSLSFIVDSNFQVLSHPSPLDVFPSSHSSFPITSPSPQISVQVVEGFPAPFVHKNPSSVPQIAFHPSLSIRFPSSHPSVPTSTPSPQTGVQVDAGVPPPIIQANPGSVCQLAAHPSPLTLLPSSQNSPKFKSPFPQLVEYQSVDPSAWLVVPGGQEGQLIALNKLEDVPIGQRVQLSDP